ncbi:hypothetical protein ACPPVO_29140 [Dactylosporangium sp. McL0621]
MSDFSPVYPTSPGGPAPPGGRRRTAPPLPASFVTNTFAPVPDGR